MENKNNKQNEPKKRISKKNMIIILLIIIIIILLLLGLGFGLSNNFGKETIPVSAPTTTISDGLSAYELAVQNGYEGTVKDFNYD